MDRVLVMVAVVMMVVCMACVPAVLHQKGHTAVQCINSSKQLHSSVSWPGLQVHLLYQLLLLLHHALLCC